MITTKEEAEQKYTVAPHDNPKRAYGRGYLRALQELTLQREQTKVRSRAGVPILVSPETVEEFLEMAKSEGIAAAEKWFKRIIKETLDRAMLGTKEDTMLLLESYIADVKASHDRHNHNHRQRAGDAEGLAGGAEGASDGAAPVHGRAVCRVWGAP